jgi:hypothetical protein
LTFRSYLSKLDGLAHNALLVLVVANFNKSAQGEVLQCEEGKRRKMRKCETKTVILKRDKTDMKIEDAINKGCLLVLVVSLWLDWFAYLAHWMALEAVIGENAAEIGVAVEVNTIHVPCLKQSRRRRVELDT